MDETENNNETYKQLVSWCKTPSATEAMETIAVYRSIDIGHVLTRCYKKNISQSRYTYISYVPSKDLSLVLENGMARSFVDCVQSCVQRSDCFSVFFTVNTTLCDYNSAELPQNATKTDVPEILYADFGLTQNPGGTTTASPLLIGPGKRVKRGPTWQWGDQDGGAGNLGTVNYFDGGYWWIVTWDLGHVNSYRMGDIYQDLIIVG